MVKLRLRIRPTFSGKTEITICNRDLEVRMHIILETDELEIQDLRAK